MNYPVNHPAPAAPSTTPDPLRVIETSDALADLTERLGHESFVTIDTEFMRERTYFPKLCLVQLGGTSETAIVDALAPGLDLAPLGRLLAQPDVTKVFHAARQDVEIFFLLFGAVPEPLYDTQVAAMVAGYGEQVGYDQLVASMTGAAIDKTRRFSDWSLRPLSAAQIGYAAADVTHLRLVYERLETRLAREGRESWLAHDMATLTDPATYRVDPEAAWRRLRPHTQNRRVLGLLRAIAAWREREAQRANVPRGWVLKDEALLEIAADAPSTPAGLARLRGVARGFAEGKNGASLLAAIAEAKREPEDELPLAPNPRQGRHAEPAVTALLKVLLAARASQHHVAARLVASSEEIERFAAGETEVPLLTGWRREVFGAEAELLRDGKIALSVDPKGHVQVVTL